MDGGRKGNKEKRWGQGSCVVMAYTKAWIVGVHWLFGDHDGGLRRQAEATRCWWGCDSVKGDDAEYWGGGRPKAKFAYSWILPKADLGCI